MKVYFKLVMLIDNHHYKKGQEEKHIERDEKTETALSE